MLSQFLCRSLKAMYCFAIKKASCVLNIHCFLKKQFLKLEFLYSKENIFIILHCLAAISSGYETLFVESQRRLIGDQQHVDPVSGIPLPHLTFIMQHILPVEMVFKRSFVEGHLFQRKEFFTISWVRFKTKQKFLCEIFRGNRNQMTR